MSLHRIKQFLICEATIRAELNGIRLLDIFMEDVKGITKVWMTTVLSARMLPVFISYEHGEKR